jgi:hypothetical protein
LLLRLTFVIASDKEAISKLNAQNLVKAKTRILHTKQTDCHSLPLHNPTSLGFAMTFSFVIVSDNEAISKLD